MNATAAPPSSYDPIVYDFSTTNSAWTTMSTRSDGRQWRTSNTPQYRPPNFPKAEATYGWKRRGGTTPSSSTGVKTNPTNFYYYYAETSGAFKYDTFGLYYDNSCAWVTTIQFQYLQYGATTGQFSVKRSDDHYDVWWSPATVDRSQTWQTTRTIKVLSRGFYIRYSKCRAHKISARVGCSHAVSPSPTRTCTCLHVELQTT